MNTALCLCLLVLGVAAGSLPPPPPASKIACGLKDEEKFDCFPHANPSQEECELRGCCFEPAKKTDLPKPDVPKCYYPTKYGGYQYLNVTEQPGGIVAFLKRTFPSTYINDVLTLRMDVEYQTDYRVRVKISDANNQRYEVPYPKLSKAEGVAENPQYSVTINPRVTGFQVQRTDGEMLFDSVDIGGFIFSDQFLQISSKFNGLMYGLGEHRSDNLALDTNWTRVSMHNYGGGPEFDHNGYGTHPYYMVMDPATGSTHGVFIHNSNSMDFHLQPLDAWTFRTLGGVLDIYFFMGPTPADVVSQYTELVGRPFMPPYWTLGFHMCRYGYGSANATRAVWESNRAAGIPFDAQWNDIDLMKERNDFTIDLDTYGEVFDLVDEIHAAGMHYVVILDPGVSATEPAGTYPPFEDGVEMDIFVKDQNGSIFLGRVWNPISTAFVDFTHPRAQEFWTKQSKALHDRLPFDALWIDMNEPYSYLDGTVDGCPDSVYETPQYVPALVGDKLYFQTICMTAKQYAGTHYNVHNIYGFSNIMVTSQTVRDVVGKRPFVLSRSSYAGAGAYTAHWSGDNRSNWFDMKKTIYEMLAFSIYGMAMTGSDVCGHGENATVALCNRWTQLGAFYPFARSHNNIDTVAQDPASMGPVVIKSAQDNLNIRYRLLPYLYTLMYRAHVYGETVSRPLFFEFTADPNTHHLDTAFLWGPALYIIPVTEENATSVTNYLPAGKWYTARTTEPVLSTGQEVTFDAPENEIPLMVRGGHVLPTQRPALTTTESRKTPFTFFAALDEAGNAQGSLFWDDGDTADTIENNQFGLLEFRVTDGSFTSSVVQWNTADTPTVEAVDVLGVKGPVAEVLVNGEPAEFSVSQTMALFVTGISIPASQPIVMTWTYQ